MKANVALFAKLNSHIFNDPTMPFLGILIRETKPDISYNGIFCSNEDKKTTGTRSNRTFLLSPKANKMK